MVEDQVSRALPRWLTVVLGLAAAIVAMAGAKAASEFVAPIVLALVMTVVVHPILAGMRRRRAPGWLAVLTAVLVADGGLIGLILVVIWSMGRLVAVLPDYADQWTAFLGHVHNGLTSLGVSSDQARTALSSAEPSAVLHGLAAVIGGLLSATGGLVLILATVLFMVSDAASLPDRLRAATGTTSPLGPALSSFSRRTRIWFVVTTVFGLIVAALDGVALWILGVPLAVVWALLSFITNYIPNVGFVIGLLPPVLLALLVNGPGSAVLVIVLYSVINFVIQSLIQPMYVGDAVGLSVTITFLSFVVWAWVLGPIGAVLAVPLSLLVESLVLETDPGAGWARALVSYGAPKAQPAGKATRSRLRRRQRREPAPAPAPAPTNVSAPRPAPDQAPAEIQKTR